MNLDFPIRPPARSKAEHRKPLIQPRHLMRSNASCICSSPLLEMLLDAQTRAEARAYARLPLSRLELSARADGERSPAIHHRVSAKMDPSSRRDA